MRHLYYCEVANDDAYELHVVLDEFLFRLFTLGACKSMDHVADIDLPFSQARALFLLAQLGRSVPINEIADSLRISVAAAGRNIDQLVGLGLVDRREDENDRRVKRVSLTEEGRTFAADHLDYKRQQLREFTTRLPAADRDRLIDALTPILAGDALRPSALRPTPVRPTPVRPVREDDTK